MHATLLDIACLVNDGHHNAFTDICRWRGDWYCAYRVAQSHGITPPGAIDMQRTVYPVKGRSRYSWEKTTTLTHPHGDIRDPKLIPSAEALWCMVGVYLPAPQHPHFKGLSSYSGDNTLVTHLTYTTNGRDWAPLTPILRPNYWGWSALAGPRCWFVCAYHTGRTGEASSLHLWAGTSLFVLTPYAGMYDGANTLEETPALWHPAALHGGKPWEETPALYRNPHYEPCEPVLYAPAPDTLACYVRTERSLDLGVSVAPYQDWRWRTLPHRIHPSAVLETRYGWVLAGRHLAEKSSTDDGTPLTPRSKVPVDGFTTSTALWAIDGHQVSPLLTLPSGMDTGYAGLCHGPEPDTIFCSWYSQHETMRGRYGTSMPGAAVYVATIGIAA